MAFGALDFCHLCAGVGEELGAVRPGHVIGQVEDLQPSETREGTAGHGSTPNTGRARVVGHPWSWVR